MASQQKLTDGATIEASVDPMDLDAVKAAGLNRGAVSARLLASHDVAERAALARHLAAKERLDSRATN